MSHSHSSSGKEPAGKRSPTFAKIFRWQLEQPGPLPVSVAIVGSFTGWEKAPLRYDRTSKVWSLTLDNIPAAGTHRYMLLVNNRPTLDKNSDGLAVPHTAEEKQFALETPRGPRVFMLFSQTK